MCMVIYKDGLYFTKKLDYDYVHNFKGQSGHSISLICNRYR